MLKQHIDLRERWMQPLLCPLKHSSLSPSLSKFLPSLQLLTVLHKLSPSIISVVNYYLRAFPTINDSFTSTRAYSFFITIACTWSPTVIITQPLNLIFSPLLIIRLLFFIFYHLDKYSYSIYFVSKNILLNSQ